MITGPQSKTKMLTHARMSIDEARSITKWLPRRKIIGEKHTDTPTGFKIDYVLEQS